MKKISKKNSSTTNSKQNQTNSFDRIYQNIMQNSTNIFYEHDLDGNFIFMSPQIEVILGYSPSDLKMKWKDLLTDNPINKNAILSTDLAIKTGVVQPPYEVELKTEGGGTAWLEIRESPVLEDGKTVSIVGTSTDISDRKNLETALQEGMNNYKLIVENQNEIIIKFDINGFFTYVNPAYCSIFNVELKDLIGKKYLPKIHPEDQRHLDGELRRPWLELHNLYHEERMMTKDGWRWFAWSNKAITENDGSVNEIVSVGRDITPRKEAEIKLNDSRIFTDNLIEVATVLIIGIDVNGLINIFNPVAEEITGYKQEELKNENWLEKLVPKDRYPEVWTEHDQLMENGFPELFEHPIMTKKGEEKIISWNKNEIIQNGKKVGIISFGNDITERKKSEEALKESEEKFSKLFQTSPNIIVISDIQTGRFIDINDLGAKKLGYNKNELIGRTSVEIGMIKQEKRNENIDLLKLQGDFSAIEKTLIKKNGELFTGLFYGQKITLANNDYLFQTIVDITERKKAERALKESERKYQTLTEVSPVGIFRTEPDGYTTYVNPRWCEISGMKAEDALGDGWLSAVYPDDRKMLSNEWENATKNELESTAEYRFVRPDGTIRWVLGNAIPELNDKGNISGYIGTITDITEGKKAEDKLRTSELRLLEAQKIAKIGHWKIDPSLQKMEGSDELLRIYGLERDEMTMGKFIELLDADDREAALTHVMKGIEFGEPWDIEHWITTKDGIRKYINSIGNIVKNDNDIVTNIVGTVQDITERKIAEEALKLSEEKFSKAFNNSPNAISISSIEGARILDINKYALDELGYKKEEVIGKTSVELGIMTENDVNIIRQELEKNGFYSGIELNVKTKAGDERIGLFYGQIIKVGGEACLFQTISDITERKKFENELRKSEERYKTIFNSTSNSLVIFDLDLNIIDANPAACEMYQYSLTEFKSLTMRDIKTPENIAAHLPKLKQLLSENGWMRFESADIKKGGEIFWTDVRLHIFRFNDESYFLDIANDITERKKAEEELKYSEEKYLKTFLSSPDSISLTSIKEGTLIEINNGFEKIFGYPREDAIGKSTIELGVWQDIKDRDNCINILKEQGRVRNYVADYNAKDGRSGTGDISMELVMIRSEEYLLTIVRDITERIKFERELKASEQKFSTAFYASPDANAISRMKDGKIIDVNPVFTKLFEYSREEAIGKTTAELNLYINPMDRNKVFDFLNKDGVVRNLTIEYKAKSGKVGFTQISIDQISIADELCLLTSIRDITDQINTQREIDDYQKKLKSLTSEITLAEERERRRIAINLHDHLSQSLAMAKIRLAEAEKQKSEEGVYNKIKDAKTFLDNAITKSRSITYELSPPVLYDLGFSAAIRWQLDEVMKEHKIKTELKDSADKILLNNEVRVLLFRAVVEIINNALKHAAASNLRVNISNNEEQLFVSVTDNGKGFDLNEAEQNAAKNRSFGIFSIKERISFIKGTMVIDSKLNIGTSVKISIPYKNIDK